MQTYIALINFTDQGIRNIKDTTKRADALTGTADSLGITIKDIYWTSGRHDGLLIFDASDDESSSAFMLTLGSGGSVKTECLRAFNRSEMETILSRIP